MAKDSTLDIQRRQQSFLLMNGKFQIDADQNGQYLSLYSVLLHQQNARYYFYINIKGISPTSFGYNCTVSREYKMPVLKSIPNDKLSFTRFFSM